MADRDVIETAARAIQIASTDIHAIDIRTMHVQVQAMTPETVGAVTEIARLQFAVPAEEETKRAREESRRLYAVAACFIAALFAAGAIQGIAWPVMVGIGVFSGIVGIPSAVARMKKSAHQPKG